MTNQERIDVTSKVEEVLESLTSLGGGGPENASGYFVLRERLGGGTVLVAEIGEYLLQNQKAFRDSASAREQGRRLLKRTDHISSWQSREEERQLYGGAIIAGPWVPSFAGLSSEHANETVSLATSLHFEWIKPEDAAKVAKISQNTLFEEYVLKYFGKSS